MQLSVMQNLADQIQTEIKSVEKLMVSQKRAIKRLLDDPVALETAEREMKALHTRLAVLQRNLTKCEAAQVI